MFKKGPLCDIMLIQIGAKNEVVDEKNVVVPCVKIARLSGLKMWARTISL